MAFIMLSELRLRGTLTIHQICPTILSTYYKRGDSAPVVLVSLKSTNTQNKSIKNNLEKMMKIKVIGNVGNGHEAQNVYDPTGIAPTVRENHGKVTKVIIPPIMEDTRTMETAQKSNGKKLKTLIASLVDSLAKRSLLPENEADLATPEVLSFLRSQDALGKNSHAFVCLRTSKAYYLTTKGQHSLPSYPRWMNWGTTVNGKCLTAKISVFPKTESECSLSDILETEVDQKYFLSEEQTEKILSLAEFSTQKLGGKDTNK